MGTSTYAQNTFAKIDKLSHQQTCNLLLVESKIKVTALNDDRSQEYVTFLYSKRQTAYQQNTTLNDGIAAPEQPMDNCDAKYNPINDSTKIKSSAQNQMSTDQKKILKQNDESTQLFIDFNFYY